MLEKMFPERDIFVILGKGLARVSTYAVPNLNGLKHRALYHLTVDLTDLTHVRVLILGHVSRDHSATNTVLALLLSCDYAVPVN